MRRIVLGIGLAIAGWTAASSAAPTAASICAERARDGDVADCRAAAVARPDDMEVQRNYALSLMAVGDYTESINVYRTVAMARPEDAEAQYELASALGFVRMFSEAIAPVERAIRLRPDHVPTYSLAAIVYVHVERMEDAVRVTLKAAELGEPTAMFDLVRYYREGIGVSADQSKALEWARRAASASHVGAMALMTRIYLEGLYGEEPDEKKALDWAAKERRARLGGR